MYRCASFTYICIYRISVYVYRYTHMELCFQAIMSPRRLGILRGSGPSLELRPAHGQGEVEAVQQGVDLCAAGRNVQGNLKERTRKKDPSLSIVAFAKTNTYV